MTSAKQTAANHENAKKSTGPKTEAGKQNSKMNALKHGLRAETHVLSDESAEEFEAFVRGVVTYLTEIEEKHWDMAPWPVEAAKRIALNLWRLRRVGRVEAGLYALGIILEQAGGLNQVALLGLKLDGQLPTDEAAIRLGEAFCSATSGKGNAFLLLARYEDHLLRMIERDKKLLDLWQKEIADEHKVPLTESEVPLAPLLPQSSTNKG
jgi:hypothetical protein